MAVGTGATSNRADICFSAPVYEKTGQSAKVDDALAAVGPLTLVDCYRFKADVLDLRGNWSAAQEWYAKAVNLAPSIPSGYYSWGVALAKHGDLAGAEAKLKDANHKVPHWADPLKAWGDVLAKQGRPKEALTRYEEALGTLPVGLSLRKLAKLWRNRRDWWVFAAGNRPSSSFRDLVEFPQSRRSIPVASGGRLRL